MKRNVLFSSAVISALCFASACEEDRGGYCEAVIECENGTQDDFDVCASMLESKGETADECGCSELFRDWIDCSLDKGTCDSTGWVLGGGDGGADWVATEDGAGRWVADESCAEMAIALSLCEADAGLDPDHGGECGD